MKKLSIALLFTTAHLVQSVTFDDFNRAVAAAKANSSPENLTKVLSILDELTDPTKKNARKITSAQIQRLQELGLGDYAQRGHRAELYRSRQAGEMPGAGAIVPKGPGLPAAPAVEPAIAVDPQFSQLAGDVLRIEARRKAIHKILGNIRIAGGASQNVKNNLIQDLDELDQDLMNTADAVQAQKTNPALSPVIQQDYEDLSDKIKQVTRDMAQTKVDAKGIRVLADVEADEAFREALKKDLDNYNAALAEVGKIPAAPGLGLSIIPVPVITAEGEVRISPESAPSIADLPVIKEEVAETKDNVENLVLNPAVEAFFIDRLIAAIEHATLEQEAAKAKEAAEKARTAEAERLALQQVYSTTKALYDQYDRELDGYSKLLRTKGIIDQGFNDAVADFNRWHAQIIGNPANKEYQDKALDAYKKAVVEFQPQGQKIREDEERAAGLIELKDLAKKYEKARNELEAYINQLNALLTKRAYKDAKNDPLKRKDTITYKRDSLEAIRSNLNKFQNSIKSDPSVIKEVNDLLDESSTIITQINDQLNSLSSENQISKANNFVEDLKKAFNIKYKGQGALAVVTWPTNILDAAPAVPGLPAPQAPTLPAPATTPAVTPTVKTPLDNAVERFAARIQDVASAEAAISELGDQELEGTLDPVNVQAVKKVIADKGIKVGQIAENALTGF